jgi:chemotaxis protein MotB
MGRTNMQPEPEEEAGAPEWMVTFSDCMTLLLTFFVLLLSFSSFDDKIFRKLKVIYSTALPSISLFHRTEKEAILPSTLYMHTEELEKGSEKPTLEQAKEEGLMKKTELDDIEKYRVFWVPSETIFWGNGTAITQEGHKIISTLASFLRKEQGQIVISENGPLHDESSKYVGLPRAWEVMVYFTTKQNLDKKRFNISGTSTLAQDDSQREEFFSLQSQKRILEIVLLERSLYN